MYYTVGVLLWLSHPAALNLASAQLSKHNVTAGRQHLHVLIRLQITVKQNQNPKGFFFFFNSENQIYIFLLIYLNSVIILVFEVRNLNKPTG